MLAYSGAQILDFVGPLEVFARTARWLQDNRGIPGPAYEIELIARKGGAIATSGGLEVRAHRNIEDAVAVDTLLVSGGIGYAELVGDQVLHGWLREQAARASRFGSICTGGLILGAAGLLNDRRATTHWAYCDKLAGLAPSCRIERDAIYVRDGNLYSSAGVTAGMDLALALVEEDWGKAVALAVAQELVMYLKRPGGQAQFSRLLEAQSRDDRFGDLILWILQNLSANLSVDELARHMAMSVRHFSRVFSSECGMTPARFVEQARVEHARARIAEGARNLKSIAKESGFGDEQRLRRAFQRTLGITPAEYQARFS